VISQLSGVKTTAMKKVILAFALLAISLSELTSQTITLKGVVTDESSSPLPGVNIVCKNNDKGTLTDIYGRFTLDDLSAKDTLVFSYLGFLTEEVGINPEESFLTLTMIEDLVALDEVVCVGYGMTVMKGLTGAVSSVSSRSRRSSKKSTADAPVVVRGLATIYGTSQNISILPGLLTAGEVNDFSKWKLWNDISQHELNTYQSIWKMNPIERYLVQLTTSEGFPVINARVNLKDETERICWSARTDNTGKAELWYNAFQGDTAEEHLSAEIFYEGQEYDIKKLKKFHKGINTFVMPVAYHLPDKVDIAFVVDATGSMIDEINYLKTELSDIMTNIRDTLPGIDLRLGCVFYRDRGDAYITRHTVLSSDTRDAIGFIQNNTADGGGDEPEAVEEALAVTLEELNWSTEARTRILFLVLDAPPHQRGDVIDKINKLTSKASEMGIRIVPLTCSGIGKETEYLMRAMALLTNGTYTFLTDDSGIGNPHIKPTTDEYNVELLNDLFIRLVYQYTHVPEIEAVLPDTLTADTLFVYQPQLLPADTAGIDDSLKAAEDPGPEKELEKSLPVIAWKYYPNPTRGQVHLESELDKGAIFVNDLSGKILERHTLDGHRQFLLDLSPYPNGIYFITYEYAPNQWVRGKVLLVRE
jgi:hypothetical protein